MFCLDIIHSIMSTTYSVRSKDSKAKTFEWDAHYDFPRDLIGYGEAGHNPQWPNNAKIAISFVINYEEGAERSVLNGDFQSENRMWEAPGAPEKTEGACSDFISSHFCIIN